MQAHERPGGDPPDDTASEAGALAARVRELEREVEAMAQGNGHLLNLLDATAIATVFLDRELRVVRYTPAACALFRFIPGDLGRPLSDLATPLRYPGLMDDARRVLKQLGVVEREVEAGAGLWYLARVLPHRTGEGQVAGVVLTFVDVSELRLAQRALRDSEARFGAIVNQAAVGVLQADAQGRIFFVNRHYARLLGYDEGELVGRPLLELVHPEDRHASAERIQQLMRDRHPFQLEKRCLRKDGTVLWMHNSAGLLEGGDDDGVRSLVVVSTDISERRRAEDALRGSEERLRMILENAVEYAIFSTDLQGRITGWNTGAQRVLGYDEPEVVGRFADLLFTDEDRAAGAPRLELQAALREGHAIDDRWHVRKDGSRFWASGVLMPMRGPEGLVGFVKILRDQSQQRAAQQALEAANRSKDRFLAVLSHELRNPLAAIHAAGMTLAEPELPPHERSRAADIVRRQAQTMKLLLDDLLDVSSLRLGRMNLRKRWVPLRLLVDAALETVRHALEGAAHALEVGLPGSDVQVFVDPVRMSQVLSNLLTNAAKYTPDGGRIGLDVRVEGGDVVFAVRDNGIGMEAGLVESMFEMFAQRPSEQRPGAGGLGIGLALVRSIVELHGGRVSGNSAGPGQGSCFTVTVPIGGLPGEPRPDPEPEPPADGGSTGRARPRVLLVDDNADAVWPIARLLGLRGFDAQVALTGREALAMVVHAPPDALVLDIGMPSPDGYEVARAVRAMPDAHHTKLIAATGWGQPDDVERTRRAGFDAHLVKPLDLDDLVGWLQRLCPTP
ncbi:PAS domain S-box protein [Pseudacidovorax intermedius]|uniref:PAS domain S-box protein n=1 Tax=Pseudacidovorax intermedius TaxID=433924 RepID=UPI00073484CE|nr:PAS domain S-box protein [Pseudacidovorax intermedius]